MNISLGAVRNYRLVGKFWNSVLAATRRGGRSQDWDRVVVVAVSTHDRMVIQKAVTADRAG